MREQTEHQNVDLIVRKRKSLEGNFAAVWPDYMAKLCAVEGITTRHLQILFIMLSSSWNGECWITRKQIAERCGFKTESNVSKYTRELEKTGAIIHCGRGENKGRYRLNPMWLNKSKTDNWRERMDKLEETEEFPVIPRPPKDSIHTDITSNTANSEAIIRMSLKVQWLSIWEGKTYARFGGKIKHKTTTKKSDTANI